MLGTISFSLKTSEDCYSIVQAYEKESTFIFDNAYLEC